MPSIPQLFVTRKITRAAAKIALGLQDKIYLGNLNAQRDWGHAKDYVRMMWMILQADKPEDWVIATGITTSIREFVRLAFAEIGLEITFKGKDKAEKGYLSGINEEIFTEKVGEQYLVNLKQKLSRVGLSPAGGGGTRSVPGVVPSSVPPSQAVVEVDLLIGDPAKANTKLGWVPEYDLKALVRDMMESDLKLMQKDQYLRKGGYETLNYFE